ncbi:MAG: NAD(P)H-hydrate dehydratase [Acidimicrobiia bacterium]
MRPVVTADEYRRVDRAYEGDLDAAMDRAGHAVALAAVRAGAGYGKKVAVLAGPGNNGGDGYVAARYLAGRGAAVTVLALGPPKTPEAKRAAESARAVGVRVTGLVEPTDEDVVVDALFGGGVRGGLPAEVFTWIDSPAPVVAVDFPTGLDPNSGKVEERAFRAVETVTFGSLKTGHLLGRGPDLCGEVTVADIGIEGGNASMYVATAEDAVRPVRERNTYKWKAGAVLVVGGSTGLSGAAVLAARGAIHFGAGSVAIASPDRRAVVSNTVEFPTFELDEAVERLDRFDVVVFGPGLAADDLPKALPVAESASSLVIDAGGLVPDVLSALKDREVEFVLTPHAGEFERLTGRRGGTFSVRALAGELGGVVLLKGNPTRISDGGLPVLVTTGGPELATIGTGDVLTGMIAALLSRGVPPLDAAVTAAYYHGIAGAKISAAGPITASDLAAAIGSYAW